MTYMKCDYCGKMQPIKSALSIQTMVLPVNPADSEYAHLDRRDICDECLDKIWNLLEGIKKDANRIDAERVADKITDVLKDQYKHIGGDKP